MLIPDIYIAAIITSALSLTVIGVILFLRSPKEQRPTLSWLFLVMLPMNALAFHWVRMPLNGWLSSALGKQAVEYQFIQTLYAPLTEEPAKLWPLLIPFFYHRMKSIPVHRVALAIGLGFGVGEAWTIASLLSKSPEISQYPWYFFVGYTNERTMVCIMHSAFTASALSLIFKHKLVAYGLLACMLLHFLGNLPIFLAGKNVFRLGAPTWQIMVQLWVVFYFLLMGAFLAYLTYENRWFKKLFRGTVRCPECQQLYEHRLFGINLLHKRYEKCLHCKNWHFVSVFDEENKYREDVLSKANED